MVDPRPKRCLNRGMKVTLFALFVSLIIIAYGKSSTPSDPLDPEESTQAIDLDDPATLEKILAEALDQKQIHKRDHESEKLLYAIDDELPYTGWVKGMQANGKIKRLAKFKKGKMVAHHEWYENGQKAVEENFVISGKKWPGLHKYWYENGQMKAEQRLIEDEWQVTYYYDQGQKESEGNMEKGERHGPWTHWDENGNKRIEQNWKNGLEHGIWITYKEDGTEYGREIYEDGEGPSIDGKVDTKPRRFFPNDQSENRSMVEQIVGRAHTTLPNTNDSTSNDVDVFDRIAQDWYKRLRLYQIDDETIQIEATTDGIKVTLFHGDEKPLFEKSSEELTNYGKKVMQRMSWLLSQHVLVFRVDSHSNHLAEDRGVESDMSTWKMSLTQGNAVSDALFHYSAGDLSDKLERITGHGSTKPNKSRIPNQPAKNRRIELSLVLDMSKEDLKHYE